jgi:hypothetical protein
MQNMPFAADAPRSPEWLCAILTTDLQTPEGFSRPMRTPNLVVLLLCVFTFSGAPAMAEEPDAVGTVTKSRGEVNITRNNQRSAANKDDAILTRDQIATGPRGLLVAKLKDDTRIFLGNNTAMTVSDLKYEKDATDNRVHLDVIKGAFRFVSGLAAKGNPDAMQVKLGKLATIGVRGTNFGGTMKNGVFRIMLLKPADGSDRPTAIIISNEFGSVTIDAPGFGTEITPGQAPSAPRKMNIPLLTCALFQ